VGLGDCWRVAAIIWHLPHWIGELIMLTAAIVWAVLLLFYLAKWSGLRMKHWLSCGIQFNAALLA
jgi:hypothetical protein